ncbi:MAG: helix-turn-helix domain-containing protein [Candidatus Omnitrophota bacterium]
MEKRMLDLKETAKYLGIAGSTLYTKVVKGEVPAYKLNLGRNKKARWRFRKIELDKLFKKYCKEEQ